MVQKMSERKAREYWIANRGPLLNEWSIYNSNVMPEPQFGGYQSIKEMIHVREVIETSGDETSDRNLKLQHELETLREKLAVAESALNHTIDFCLCDQISTKGFDYGEDHKRCGKAQAGQRWKTPRECAREALAKVGVK